jgi:hypothetical protein
VRETWRRDRQTDSGRDKEDRENKIESRRQRKIDKDKQTDRETLTVTQKRE